MKGLRLIADRVGERAFEQHHGVAVQTQKRCRAVRVDALGEQQTAHCVLLVAGDDHKELFRAQDVAHAHGERVDGALVEHLLVGAVAERVARLVEAEMTVRADAEHLQRTNPAAFRHEYGGEVVGSGAAVFANLQLRAVPDDELERYDRVYYGVDWGWYPDPWAYNAAAYDAAGAGDF